MTINEQRRNLAISLGDILIGTAMMRPGQYAELAEIASAEDFPQPRQVIIWRLIGKQIAKGQPVDPASLTLPLQRSGSLGAVNVEGLLNEFLEHVVPVAVSHAEDLAGLARVAAVEKDLRAALLEIDTNPAADLMELTPLLDQASAVAKGARASSQPLGRRQLKLTRASDIEAEPVVWAWEDSGKGRIPSGSMVVAAGREGTGKSSYGKWMTAHITRGTLPGAFWGKPRAVFYVAVEDSWRQTIVPRLMVSGADLNLVFRVEAMEAEFGETTLSLPQDNSMLEKAIMEHDVALVVLDPLMSCIGQGIDTHRERDVRTALDPLARMAERTGVVMLGIAHFNKGSGTDPSALITGSGAFKNVPRAVFGFAKDQDAGCRVMTQAKNSLGQEDLPSLSYTIEGTEVQTKKGVATVGKFVFLGESERSVDEILAAGNETDRSEQTEAAEWLIGYLVDQGGEADSKDIKKAARADDIAERTLQRAMRKAGVTSERAGFGKGAIWRLNVGPSATQRDGTSAVAPQSRQSRQGSEGGADGATVGANGAGTKAPSLRVVRDSEREPEPSADDEPEQTPLPDC